MDPKFIRKGNTIYMRVVELSNGLADLSQLAGLALSPLDWKELAACAMQQDEDQPNLMTTEELANALGCSRALVTRYVEQGMPHIDLADPESQRRHLRFELAKCKAWLNQKGAQQ